MDSTTLIETPSESRQRPPTVASCSTAGAAKLCALCFDLNGITSERPVPLLKPQVRIVPR